MGFSCSGGIFRVRTSEENFVQNANIALDTLASGAALKFHGDAGSCSEARFRIRKKRLTLIPSCYGIGEG